MRLVFSDVDKTYRGPRGDVRALQSISMSLNSGDFVSVQGPSGCGKSTMLLIAGGLLRPDAGQVTYDDANIYELPPEKRTDFRAAHIGFVFQQFHLVPYLSVLDNVLAAADLRRNGNPRELRERADSLLARFGLSDRADHVPAALSTGERQRAALARALLNEPQWILADEPTGNLDEANAQVVLNHLAGFAESGGAVLLVTHDRNAAQHAQSCMIMDAGRIVSETPQSGGSG